LLIVNDFPHSGLAEPASMQPECDPGVVIFGHKGDPKLKIRPDWTKNGSILAFRKLKQYVPEFDKFVSDHPADPTTLPANWQNLSKEELADLTGARLFGRWKSVSRHALPNTFCSTIGIGYTTRLIPL